MARSCCRAVLIVVAGATPALGGGVVTDGTMGPQRTLSGPNHVVDAGLGTRRGGNLFHSFSRLDLDKGQAVTFTGPADVRNVLARVTGGRSSSIDGTIASEIAGANLYLINPHGILFGPNARLSVSGSFIATTADMVKFADGGRFAARNPGDTVLSSAEPSAFGFLGPSASALRLRGQRGSPSKLTVPEGSGVSLIGGEVELRNAALRAPAGWLNIAAVDGAGDAVVDPSSPGLVDSIDATARGDLSILDRSRLDTSAATAGSVTLRGRNLSINNSVIDSTTVFSMTPGGAMTLDATGNMTLRAARAQTSTLFAGDSGPVSISAGETLEVLDRAVTGSSTIGPGNAGDVEITAGRIVISGDGSTGVISGTVGPGNAGAVTLRAPEIIIEGDAQVRASTVGIGAGGAIDVQADTIILRGDGVGNLGGVVSNASGQDAQSGDAGAIRIVAGSLGIESDAAIVAGSDGTGDGGAIDVTADTLLIDGAGLDTSTAARITSASTGAMEGAGNAGAVNVRARQVLVTNSGLITAATQGPGAAGVVSIAAEAFRADNGALISSATLADGPAGNVVIDAQTVEVADAALVIAGSTAGGNAGGLTITASRLDVSLGVVSTGAEGAGNAGSVRIDADEVRVFGGAINARSSAGGASGNVEIAADRLLRLGDGGLITAASAGIGPAGAVRIDTPDLRISGGARLSAESAGGGRGGDVTVNARRLTVDGTNDPPESSSSILATTRGDAPGGNISLRATRMTLLNGAVISAATGGAGDGGNLAITADALTIAGANNQQQTFISAQTSGPGSAGRVDLDVSGDLRIAGGAFVSAATFGDGPGGNIDIDAGRIVVDGGRARQKLTIVLAGSVQGAGGDGGQIDIRAGRVEVVRRGLIVAGSDGPGDGGNVRVASTGDVRLSTGTISAASDPTESDFPSDRSGKAGDVLVSGRDVRLDGQSLISALSARTDGGTVSISSARNIDLFDSRLAVQADRVGGSVIMRAPQRILLFRSQVNAEGNDAIGKIDIDPRFVVLSQSSLLTSTQPGGGGNIEITADNLFTDRSTITAAGELIIDVLNVDSDITAGLLELRGDFIDEAARLKEACGLTAGTDFSSFIVEGRGGVPAAPGTPFPSPTTQPGGGR